MVPGLKIELARETKNGPGYGIPLALFFRISIRQRIAFVL